MVGTLCGLIGVYVILRGVSYVGHGLWHAPIDGAVLSILLTLSIIASMNVVGVTMIAATLIVTALTARMMTDSFSRMLIYSVLICSPTGVIGTYLSYILNLPLALPLSCLAPYCSAYRCCLNLSVKNACCAWASSTIAI
ncbi:iron/zinc/copper transport system permease protein [Nitrosospira sp. Nsp18]|uniref:metal ABC transporter permease n=1 Tax=Nitrosospira sp. Nsp18 TaxID=1855334 RepID=UPI0008885B4E|nr:metal ABC transporter permease [Nitrosospira sp. Nsp18]SDA15574.1 iron/zinc/copper transport system permease protein [Nitrosospira sp. Nsp18]